MLTVIFTWVALKMNNVKKLMEGIGKICCISAATEIEQ